MKIALYNYIFIFYIFLFTKAFIHICSVSQIRNFKNNSMEILQCWNLFIKALHIKVQIVIFRKKTLLNYSQNPKIGLQNNGVPLNIV